MDKFNILKSMILLGLVLYLCIDVCMCHRGHGPYLNPFLNKEAATTYLSRGRRAVVCTGMTAAEGADVKCTGLVNEHSCEFNKELCSTETDREYYCHHFGTVCTEGNYCYLSTPCPKHYATGCRDIDECDSSPCQNNGTCYNGHNFYNCTCAPGYEGVNCEIDINECESEPCQNGGTCNNHVNMFTCTCAEDFTGTNCEIDMCLPQNTEGADVVFLLDSSSSQGETLFVQQKEYIKDFIANFKIGPDNFQFSVISFSLEASVHFQLDTHTSITTMYDAIDALTYTGGVSYTHTALQTAREIVLLPDNGARSSVYKYIIILTDGLSSNNTKTVMEADILKQYGVYYKLIAVGIGAQIYHEELLAIASDFTQVFPATNPDALNTILKSHVMTGCPDCFHNTTDLAIVMDASVDVPNGQFYSQIDAIRMLLKVSPISTTGVHVSYTRFAENVTEEFDFSAHSSAADTIVAIQSSLLLRLSGNANITKVLEHMVHRDYLSAKGQRSDARKMILLFTNGIYQSAESIDAVKEQATLLKDNGVTLVTIGFGKDTNISLLLDIASDPAFVYILGDDVYTSLDVLYSLVGSLQFDVCEMD